MQSTLQPNLHTKLIVAQFITSILYVLLSIILAFKDESDDGFESYNGEFEERNNKKRGSRKAKPPRRKNSEGGDNHSGEKDAEVSKTCSCWPILNCTSSHEHAIQLLCRAHTPYTLTRTRTAAGTWVVLIPPNPIYFSLIWLKEGKEGPPPPR